MTLPGLAGFCRCSEPQTADDYRNYKQKTCFYSHFGTNLTTQESDNKNQSLSSGMAGAFQKDGNFLQFQTETQELLDKLEHYYKGEYIHTDKEGNQSWKQSKDPDARMFNEHGVNLMMETVSKYIDKHTSLSRYKEQRINEILYDLGNDLVLVIFCNYEKMGMDNYFKKTKFRLIITTTSHIIESAYRKAIDGKFLEEINQSKIVTQSDNIGRSPGIPMPQKKKASFFNPSSWGG